MSPTDLRRIDASSRPVLSAAPAIDTAIRSAAQRELHARGLDDYRTAQCLFGWGAFGVSAAACASATVVAELTPVAELGVGVAGLVAATGVTALAYAYFERRIAAWNDVTETPPNLHQS